MIPPWQNVDVLEPSNGLEEGARIRLRIRNGPVRFDWTVEHDEVEEGRHFQDRQVEGPFASWRHRHRFEPAGDGGCVLEDEIEWEPPLGSFGEAFSRSSVERTLERLVRFRQRRLAHDLDRLSSYGDRSLRVGITGASGLVGSALSSFLRAGGHRVVPLVRSREAAGEEAIYWNVEEGAIEADRVETLDAFVHLAGESIFALRWTEARKQAILESRRRGTRLVAETLAGLDDPPRVLMSASAVHAYGTRGEEILTEDSSMGEGFLARVCREWERATEPAVRAGIRVVTFRSGVVLTPAGGALEKMLLPFRLGLGGRIGSGRQYFSWIDADDQVGLLYHALRRREVEGPLNAVAPHPVPNAAFVDALGRVLGRPTILPLPALAVKGVFGEMGREVLLRGQRVVPEKALSTGFEFHFPGVESSFRHQLGREGPDESKPAPKSSAGRGRER